MSSTVAGELQTRLFGAKAFRLQGLSAKKDAGTALNYRAEG